MEDSQATQALQGLLDLGVDSWTPKSSRRITREDGPSISKDISSDSSPPRNANNVIPVYDFHGLASTQTQTQHHDEEIQLDEGSQKENIKTSKSSGGETLDAMDTRSSRASSSKPSRRRSPNEEQGAQPLSHVTKVLTLIVMAPFKAHALLFIAKASQWQSRLFSISSYIEAWDGGRGSSYNRSLFYAFHTIPTSSYSACRSRSIFPRLFCWWSLPRS